MDFPEALSGKDLIEFGSLHHLGLDQMVNIFGVGRGKLLQYLNNKEVIVDDAAVAILFRMFESYPELMGPPEITVEEFWERLKEQGVDIQPRDLALLLGREPTAYVRWFNGGNECHRSIKSILAYAMHLAGNDPEKALNIIKACFIRESEARKTSPLESLTWSLDKTARMQRKRSRSVLAVLGGKRKS